MNPIIKELVKGKNFSLYQVKNRQNGRVHYKIKTDIWTWRDFSSRGPDTRILDVRNHFNPNGDRAGRLAYSWKFSNRKDAEQLLVMAILKWGA